MRLAGAWRALESEQRRAALASLGLFASMFLPWYSKTILTARPAQTTLSAFQDFSFVEAAVLLVSAGVLAMLYARAERRGFELPGGDGMIVMIAGGWTALLIFYRLLDKPGLQHNQSLTGTVGVQWGIFIALLVALGLLYAGARMRTAEGSHPRRAGDGRGVSSGVPAEDPRTVQPLAADRLSPTSAESQQPSTVVGRGAGRQPATPAGAAGGSARKRPRYPPAPAEQMSFEDPPASAE